MTSASVRLRRAELYYAHADLKLQLAWTRTIRAADARVSGKYRPDQPRAPKGTPEGGQWVFAGGSTAQSSTERLVAQAIEAITKHGVDQIISRSIAPADILDALHNPLKVRRRSNMTTQYIGKGTTVVLNDYGGLVTIWGR